MTVTEVQHLVWKLQDTLPPTTVLDRDGGWWKRVGNRWEQQGTKRMRTHHGLAVLAPLTFVEPWEAASVNGVNIPGQWLTPAYLAACKRKVEMMLPEPAIGRCDQCGEMYLERRKPGHVCPLWNVNAHKAALPWRTGAPA